jgi:hypothetical protein
MYAREQLGYNATHTVIPSLGHNFILPHQGVHMRNFIDKSVGQSNDAKHVKERMAKTEEEAAKGEREARRAFELRSAFLNITAFFMCMCCYLHV